MTLAKKNGNNFKHRSALITGITGQDGAYLSKLLLDKGYRVYGSIRRTSDTQLSRLKELKIDKQVELVTLELSDYSTALRAIEKIRPDEVYNLAAQSSVAFSFNEPLYTVDVSGLGPLRILEAIRTVDPRIKFYQASSSEMFGNVRETPQNEKTPFRPRSPYAVARLLAHWATVNYREAYGLFACSGILYNHESPLRASEFVSRKIVQSVVRIKSKKQDELRIGNLDAKRDWGYAPEYVEAMWLMLQQNQPDDFVIASGETHSVREFIQLAFSRMRIPLVWKGEGVNEVGCDPKTGRVYVRVDPAYFRPADVTDMRGDTSKARKKIGWKPRTGFRDLVHLLVDHERSYS
jgi:GDPmannose 4,6-dehydratase